MTDFLLGVASFVLVLVPLVIIHEFGHFIAAKIAGITVLEFGIGFPPRAATLFTRGDTIYTINWLPIGGFVRPYGEDFVRPKTEDELSTDRSEIEERGIKNPKSVFEAGPWERMLFMAAGPGINLILALVLFILVALVGQPFGRADVTVVDLDEDSAAMEAGLLEDDIILFAGAEKMESADDFNDWINARPNELVTLTIERNGAQMDITMVATPSADTSIERVYITGIVEDKPADGKFLEEDLIIAVNGEEITSIEQLQDITQDHEDREMVVTVLRGAEQLDIPVAPTEDDDGVVRIGITISEAQPAAIGLTAVNRDTETYTRALPFGEAVETGVDEFVTLHKIMYEFVGDIFRGDVSLSEARPVSPIGIGQIGGPVFEQTLDEGEMYPIVLFAAFLSVALAITNLLPIPGLDGGRILFVIIELIRGKPMAPEREGLIHLIGVLLLLGLIFLAVINDIVNPINLTGGP
ncbi:MAG: RIP metalloprotease RseP [Anaerolineae bacterium]|nr:RIP metalloprotease RseP [Anaerolineae bacterium]